MTGSRAPDPTGEATATADPGAPGPAAPAPVACRAAILVNGLPASGKSTLAPRLARALGLPLFAKDVIKETHADVLGVHPPDDRPQRAWNATLGRAASETMWALLADAPLGAVLESSWRADVRPLVQAGLARARVTRAIEIWCDVPAGVSYDRDRARWADRHRIHGARISEPEWAAMVADGRPLAIGPVLRVDTTGPVDVGALAAWCRTELGRA
ncbi:glucokinase [Actinopolymorpha cephalotaxi]|uniref:Glucokinase n=1 Tax=Actinopolymorpha cephalotaxi TaxID=504797 RepID=A0A1I2W566_9ACTN|nr:AAA family ATPase [Actinopolymorpha cephalotaxi]NYH82747.1 glucokinase [Actinopolymorpha cephalotaxi]SFG96544.1 glucokinase [Actinopolymorpha cephalotaxi]